MGEKCQIDFCELKWHKWNSEKWRQGLMSSFFKECDRRILRSVFWTYRSSSFRRTTKRKESHPHAKKNLRQVLHCRACVGCGNGRYVLLVSDGNTNHNCLDITSGDGLCVPCAVLQMRETAFQWKLNNSIWNNPRSLVDCFGFYMDSKR